MIGLNKCKSSDSDGGAAVVQRESRHGDQDLF